jgi:outer membrane protein assembly factor BamB
MWGFASSPLLVEGLVMVYAGGEGDKGMLAYRAASGAPAWSAPAGHNSYSSPQLARLGGRDQVLMFSDDGVAGVAPADGAVLWKHNAQERSPRSVQPLALDDRRVMFGNGLDLGVTMLEVTPDGGGWKTRQVWTSRGLKPSFNDFVVQGDSAYGMDGIIMSCIDLNTGERRWKGGRYGHGQVMLLADQRLLLVTTEKGEVVLIAADPSAHHELARFQAINGKTWNHPAIAGGRLYVRNAEEIACYELVRSGDSIAAAGAANGR